MKKNIIFFDVETNGFRGSSVLSISALKVLYDYKTEKWCQVSEYDRFYYRNAGEEVNEKAISINGLTDDEIKRLRGNNIYGKTFLEDINDFYDFCSDTSHFVAHNIKFDREFIPFVLKNQFDTMEANINILKIPNRYNGYKYPKLMECAQYYKVPLNEEYLHSSLYDVKIMARVFYIMSKNKHTKEKIFKFINKD